MCVHCYVYLVLLDMTYTCCLPLSQEVARNSITHNATVIANGLMHFGTTSDLFLRENLEWLKRASNWAKFSATASLGLIHYVSGVCVKCLCLMSVCLATSYIGP